MPGRQRLRWPNGSETIRVDCIAAAKTAANELRAALERLDRARSALATQEAELLIADASRELAEAIAQMEYVQRRLIEAKVGE